MDSDLKKVLIRMCECLETFEDESKSCEKYILSRLKEKTFKFIQIDTSEPFLTDAPASVLNDIKVSAKNLKKDSIETYIITKGYDIIWLLNLKHWFGKETLSGFVKYLTNEHGKNDTHLSKFLHGTLW